MLPLPRIRSGEDRADDPDDDVHEDALLGVGAHNQAGKPAHHTTDDEPNNDTHFSFLLFVATPLNAGRLPASETHDAGMLFRQSNARV